jgi:2-desacetyl-2-hydroxyethyl bacteriochlorophyllide A dehydrogenase
MTATYPMAYVTAPGKIEFKEHSLPELGEKDVKIKVKVAAICGSDLHIYKGKHPSAPLPVPIGHEIAGEVVETGPKVTRFKPGDRVAVEPVIACGECFFCQRGQYHLCTQISFQYRQGQGGFTPYFIASEKWLHSLPENVTYTEGALLEPLAVATHAVQKSHPNVGQTSAVFGAGAIGMLVTQLLKQTGGSDIIVVDVNQTRLETALELGATTVLNNRDCDALAEILKLTDQLGVDIAYEAVGLEITLIQALNALRKGGLAVLLGIFEQTNIQLPVNLFVQKEITLAGSQGYNWDFQTALRLLELKQVNLERMVTHHFPLSQLQQAFETLSEPDHQAIKVAITIN